MILELDCGHAVLILLCVYAAQHAAHQLALLQHCSDVPKRSYSFETHSRHSYGLVSSYRQTLAIFAVTATLFEIALALLVQVSQA